MGAGLSFVLGILALAAAPFVDAAQTTYYQSKSKLPPHIDCPRLEEHYYRLLKNGSRNSFGEYPVTYRAIWQAEHPDCPDMPMSFYEYLWFREECDYTYGRGNYSLKFVAQITGLIYDMCYSACCKEMVLKYGGPEFEPYRE